MEIVKVTGQEVKLSADKSPKVALPPSGKKNRNRLITTQLISKGIDVAKACEASTIFISLDMLSLEQIKELNHNFGKIIYITKNEEIQDVHHTDLDIAVLKVPNVPLTRISQIKISVFLALSRGIIHHGDTVLFMTGLSESSSIDTVMVAQVNQESELFSYLPLGEQLAHHQQVEVLERVIDLAVQIGSEGREGKPVGAMFVVGDSEKVLALSRQLVLNPFKGYPEDERSILRSHLDETVKEFSSIDGAFIIRSDGVIEACGAFLKTADVEGELPQGLGARHHVAAGITSVTDSVAITVSESTGTVTIFNNGRIMTEIEKPRRHAGRQA